MPGQRTGTISRPRRNRMWDEQPRLANLTIVFLGAAAMWVYPLFRTSWDGNAVRERGLAPLA
jgi:hypothetical protein